MAQAQKRRDEFISELTGDLLTPLGEHVKNELKEVMPEIDLVAVHPFVPTLEDILSGAKITVKDSADTALLNKGTGVRGAFFCWVTLLLGEAQQTQLGVGGRGARVISPPEGTTGLAR